MIINSEKNVFRVLHHMTWSIYILVIIFKKVLKSIYQGQKVLQLSEIINSEKNITFLGVTSHDILVYILIIIFKDVLKYIFQGNFFYKYHELWIHNNDCFYGVFQNILNIFFKVKCIFSNTINY